METFALRSLLASSLAIAVFQSPSLRRCLLSVLFVFDFDTRVLPLRLIPQELLLSSLAWVAYSTVVQLDAVCDPGAPRGTRLCVLAAWPAPSRIGSALRPNYGFLGALSQIQGLHPSPRCSHSPFGFTSIQITERFDSNLTRKGFCPSQ